MSLKDAVHNLNIKIANAANSATAEEIAYLATAVERIGGRVSVFELADFADDKKVELGTSLDTAKALAISAVNANKDARLAELVTLRDQALSAMTTTKSDSQAALVATKSSAELSVTTTKATAETAMLATKDASLAAVTAAAATALAQILGQRGRMMFFSTF